MKLVRTVVLIFCLYSLQGAEGRRDDQGLALPGKNGNTAPTSGELETTDKHRCTWEISDEGKDTLLLLLSCTHDSEVYQCRYAGRPGLCHMYSILPGQYWSQVVARLRNRAHACQGGKVLRARSCKKAPVESHMKLLTGRRTEAGVSGGERGRARGRHRRKSASTANRVKLERRPPEEQGGGYVELSDDSTRLNMEPAESYCAEGWQTVCSFFVKFFDG